MEVRVAMKFACRCKEEFASCLYKGLAKFNEGIMEAGVRGSLANNLYVLMEDDWQERDGPILVIVWPHKKRFVPRS